MLAALTDAATTGGITAGGTIFGIVLVLYKAGFFNGSKKITQEDLDKAKAEGEKEANQDAWQKDTTKRLTESVTVLHSIKKGIDKLNEKEG